MIKCIAIDDEPLALEVIEIHCSKIPQVDLIGTFLSARDAIDFLKNEVVDIVFLDINMPEITGLEMKLLIPDHINVVFVTAFEEYALKSYELEASDYLLKPVSFERFNKAIQKCSRVKEEQSLKQSKDYLLVRGDKKIVRILISDIRYIEGLKDYAKIYYGADDKIIIRESLRKILKRLEDHKFIRVHRSYIIPFNKITSVYGNTVKVGEQEIPLGKQQKDILVEAFRKKGILGDRSV